MTPTPLATSVGGRGGKQRGRCPRPGPAQWPGSPAPGAPGASARAWAAGPGLDLEDEKVLCLAGGGVSLGRRYPWSWDPESRKGWEAPPTGPGQPGVRDPGPLGAAPGRGGGVILHCLGARSPGGPHQHLGHGAACPADTPHPREHVCWGPHPHPEVRSRGVVYPRAPSLPESSGFCSPGLSHMSSKGHFHSRENQTVQIPGGSPLPEGQ